MQDFCERFFEKIFKSFPDRQNFKIFPQRACKHLQNTKKYVIINKLISITIKKRPHGQAVKTLPSHGRICGSIPHGATKKNASFEAFFLCNFLNIAKYSE